MMSQKGKLLLVGFGPGSFDHLTFRAKEAIEESDLIIGYKTYIELIRDLLTEDQEIISTGMTEEVSRAQEAVRQAESGRKVAVISSGDAGVYGMAGIVYEVLMAKGWTEADGVDVEVIPGISAINSCASLIGAPIMHDACTISLSDHLTPWTVIEKRIEAAGQADFVVALYNPKSGLRTRQIVEAQKILLKYRDPNTPVGLVKSAYRVRQNIVLTNLAEMLEYEIGMLTTVIIGNSTTKLYDGKMVTPRGYERKYTLDKPVEPQSPRERLSPENEPWALHQPERMKKLNRQRRRRKKSNKQSSGAKDDQDDESGRVNFTTSNDHSLASLATEALATVRGEPIDTTDAPIVQQPIQSIFELGVKPGIVNKRFTPEQMKTLAEVVGEEGTMEYSTNHQIRLRIPTDDPDSITEKLRAVGFVLVPVGEVASVKACDFCYGEKTEGIPYAVELHERLSGIELPKRLNVGINGCGMACYQPVMDDIGIVFRRGKFDLFIGAKPVGRTAHAGQPVEEGVDPEDIIELVTNIVQEYKENAYPNERLFKYFRRVKRIAGYEFVDMLPKISLEPAPCED